MYTDTNPSITSYINELENSLFADIEEDIAIRPPEYLSNSDYEQLEHMNNDEDITFENDSQDRNTNWNFYNQIADHNANRDRPPRHRSQSFVNAPTWQDTRNFFPGTICNLCLKPAF